MPILPDLKTERLLLRDWRGADFSAFCALNADPQVARYLPGPLNAAQSQGFFERITAHIVQHGLGLFAVVPKDEPQRLIGYCGLNLPSFKAPFTPLHRDRLAALAVLLESGADDRSGARRFAVGF